LPTTARRPFSARSRTRSTSNSANRAICSASPGTGSLKPSQASTSPARRPSSAKGRMASTAWRATGLKSAWLRSAWPNVTRPTIRVSGERAFISARKAGSNSRVLISATLPVATRSMIWGWYQATNRPSLVGGPGGKGVGGGVGVAVGGRVAVGGGASVAVGDSGESKGE